MARIRLTVSACLLVISHSCFSSELTDLVYSTAVRYGIDPVVFHSLITQESGDPKII